MINKSSSANTLGSQLTSMPQDHGAIPSKMMDNPRNILLKRKRFRSGDLATSGLLIALLCILLLSIIFNETHYVAVHNFIETYIFGFILYFIFFNEAENKDINLIINAIVVTAFLLSLGMLLEWSFSRNPIMESAIDTLYLSPELNQITGGFYRPYVTFFHPSESGLFIAMCLPFIYHKVKESKRVWSGALFIMIIVLGAVVINCTRGVWLALVVSVFIYLRRLRWPLLCLAAVVIIFTILATFFFQDLPFVRRLSDPQNLINRFFYWGLALEIFMNNVLIGIGHMNFKEVYLNFVQTTPIGGQFDPQQISVVDNIYLTTLAEFGLLGITALLAFWTGALTRLHGDCCWLKNIDGKTETKLALLCLSSITIYLLAGLLADVHQFTKATKLVFIMLGLGFSTLKKTHKF